MILCEWSDHYCRRFIWPRKMQKPPKYLVLTGEWAIWNPKCTSTRAYWHSMMSRCRAWSCSVFVASPSLLPSSVFCRSVLHLTGPSSAHRCLHKSSSLPHSRGQIVSSAWVAASQAAHHTEWAVSFFSVSREASLNLDFCLFSFFETQLPDRTYTLLAFSHGCASAPASTTFTISSLNPLPCISALPWELTEHLHWTGNRLCVCILGPGLRRNITPWITSTKLCENCCLRLRGFLPWCWRTTGRSRAAWPCRCSTGDQGRPTLTNRLLSRLLPPMTNHLQEHFIMLLRSSGYLMKYE